MGTKKSESDDFMDKGHHKKYSPNEILLKEGGICNSWIYLKSGVARHFLITEEGKDITKNFNTEHSYVFTSISSFLTGKPSTVQFQALTECEVIKWDKSVFDSWLKQDPWKELYHEKLEELILKKELKEISLLNDSAEKRYLKFFKTKGFLFNIIPHYYIASFLSMSPETLSRIRKKQILI